ncbi:MAG: ABC transporter substrate-binding protein [Deltaproteobacteria bacterium]|nr:ABC transporter substrate-binding protein [Deltaproteobacteria bacterium]
MRPVSIFVVITTILIVLTIGIAAPLQAAEKKPVVVGFIHSMSGAMSMYGISSEAGGQIAVEEINAAGGILGRPLKMITRDDKLNPEVGLREAKDLLLSEKADFLSGTISSAVALAISNHVKREKKIFIVNISQSSSITEENGHRYIFRIDTNAVPYWGYAPAIALANTWKDKKIVSLGFDYETGKNSLKAFKEKYFQLIPDAKIIDELWAPLGTTDFTAYITKIANSGADAFFLSCIYGGGELAFTKQAYAFGLYDKMHAIQHCAGDVETWHGVKKGEPYPKGTLATGRFPFWAIDDPKSKSFVEKHNKKVSFYPSYGAMNQYVIMYALKAAIEKAGGVDTEKIINALENMNLDTFVGKIPIRAYDHQAMMPTWYGIMDFSPSLPFPHLAKTQGVMGEESYHTVEQIKKLRQQK